MAISQFAALWGHGVVWLFTVTRSTLSSWQMSPQISVPVATAMLKPMLVTGTISEIVTVYLGIVS